MTEARTALRKRRRNGAADGVIPADVAEWFAAGCPHGVTIPWGVLLPQTSSFVPTWWAAWRREHPGAAVDERSRFLLEVRA